MRALSPQVDDRQPTVSRILGFSSNADGADNNIVDDRERSDGAAAAANNGAHGEDGPMRGGGGTAMDHDAGSEVGSLAAYVCLYLGHCCDCDGAV